jgi:[CysO sulfur-carrier protein]-S-L-cysteine hydrolase
MFSHAKRELPNEACGILAGRNGKAVNFSPATNVGNCPLYPINPNASIPDGPHTHTQACGSPTRYRVDPQDQARFINLVRKNGWDEDPWGIFHSHTHTQAYPSSTDVSLAANYPDAVYLIVSLQYDPPVLRAFRIQKGQVSEEELTYSE